MTAAGDVTTEELAARLGESGLVLLDVRSPAEYEGTLGAPCDPRQGHIPGARLLELSELLGLSPEQLQAAVGVAPGVEVIAYCHSGSRSQVAVAALRSAGYVARNYVASWHAWSRDASLPAETGR
ncbi:MAG TPA: rhodanese-like domain-containing protein [Gaiellaceae bacterium]|nr:rhodanese-like domain-containing protein [Gaiellaceae bacterium]